MKETNQITACVCDNPGGLFLPLALKLAQSYKRVFYQTPCEEGFSTVNKASVGKGFDNLVRVRDVWSIKRECDLFIFPDIEHSGLQLELEEQGYAVWGSRKGDELELNRKLFLEVLKDHGLDVPNYVICNGLTQLRDYLLDAEDKYVKISRYRGSMETWHWRDSSLDEGRLCELGVRFGPVKDLIPFIVLDNIDTPLEIGGDTYCIDGQWPSLMLHGDEWKDEGYIGAVTKRQDMPDQIQAVLDEFGPILGKSSYRNFFSMELRVKGEQSFFIDPTCRGGLPSMGSQMELWKNLPEIIWYGANGNLVDPVPAAKFSAECALTAKGEKKSWAVVDVPPSLEQWMKLAGACQVDAVCFPPDDSHGDEIGWLVAIGNSVKEVIDNIVKQSKLLPDGVHAKTECLVNLLKEIHESEQKGIEFTDQPVPDPAIVVEAEA